MIEPALNSFIINTVDMLQVLSNDRFVAPEHRVLSSVGSQYRPSAANFFNPPFGQVIHPKLPKHVDSNDDQPRYRVFTWKEFHGRRQAGDYEDLGEEVQISRYRV